MRLSRAKMPARINGTIEARSLNGNMIRCLLFLARNRFGRMVGGA